MRNQSGFEDTDVIENLTLDDMDNGGSQRFKHFKNYKFEPGRIGGREAPALSALRGKWQFFFAWL